VQSQDSGPQIVRICIIGKDLIYKENPPITTVISGFVFVNSTPLKAFLAQIRAT
jgi:hypothetical protein